MPTRIVEAVNDLHFIHARYELEGQRLRAKLLEAESKIAELSAKG